MQEMDECNFVRDITSALRCHLWPLDMAIYHFFCHV